MEKMKRLFVIFTLVLILPLSLMFTSCDKDDKKTVKLPTTAYEKVQFAFDGVESSFSGADSGSNGHAAHASSSVFPFSSTDDALTTIFEEYAHDDEPKNSLDGLSYTEPPMIQFQCLKYVFEKIGDDYQFGTKYYNTITGTVYLDMETGLSMKNNPSNEYKYNFAFTLAVDISIDENDLIKADVSFKITLTKDAQEFNTQWYVSMELDYDMKTASPNYTLLMLTDNQEGDLEYLNIVQGYEYDYVEVQNNQIKEWRKFNLDSNETLVVDETHQTFDDYASKEGFEFRVGNCKWYKDGKLHKFTRLNKPDGEERKLKIARELYSGLKLNTTDINASEFIGKQGEQNEVINTLYTDFSNVIREELIYNLVCKNEDDIQQQSVGITIKTINNGAWEDYSLERDATLYDLLTEDSCWGQGFMNSGHPHIFYIDKFGGIVERVENKDIDNFSYKITIGNVTKDISLSDYISDMVVNEFGGKENFENNDCKFTITVTENEHPSFTATFSAHLYHTETIELKESMIFPNVLLEMGVPKYDSQKASFELTKNGKEGNDYTLLVTNSYNDELNEYKEKLETNGFINYEGNKYLKIIDSNVLIISAEFNDYNLYITIKFEANSGYTTTWQTNTILGWLEGKFNNFPALSGTNFLCKMGDDYSKFLYVYGLTNDEYNNYIASIGELENVAFAGKYDAYMTSGQIIFIYGGYYYSIDYQIESGYLYFEFNLERNGSQEVNKLIVNNSDTKIFEITGWNMYSLTISLQEGDTFVIEPNNIGHYLTSFSDYFSYELNQNNKTMTYTVLQSGNYTFSYNGALMEVSKG